MTIELKPEHQRTIELAMESGAFQNRDEVLDQVFEMLRQQLDDEAWMGEQRDALASQIGRGFAQAEQGQLIDGEDVIRMLRQRHAEWRKTQE